MGDSRRHPWPPSQLTYLMACLNVPSTRLQEFNFIDADDRQDVIDARNCCFTDTNTRYVRRFNQADIDNPSATAVECRIKICGRHPTRRTASDDEKFF